MLLHCRVTHRIKFFSIHLYIWMERRTMRVNVNVLSKNTTLCLLKGLEAELLDSEMSALTISQLCLPQMEFFKSHLKKFFFWKKKKTLKSVSNYVNKWTDRQVDRQKINKCQKTETRNVIETTQLQAICSIHWKNWIQDIALEIPWKAPEITHLSHRWLFEMRES